MEISNKTLALFLLAAIVVSLGGTIVSLNKLGKMGVTGYASSDTGTVQLTVQNSVSITLDTFDTVNFGSCTPVPGFNTIVNSEVGVNTSSVCSGFTANNHTLRNDGNVDVNITINSTRIGENNGGTGATLFLDSANGNSSLAYKTEAHGRTTVGGRPGCLASNMTATAYTNFTTAGARTALCRNLTWGATNNSITVDFQIVVPSDAVVGATSTTIEYFAEVI